MAEIPSNPTRGPAPVPRVVRKKRRTSIIIASGVVVALLIALAVGVWWFLQSGSSATPLPPEDSTQQTPLPTSAVQTPLSSGLPSADTTVRPPTNPTATPVADERAQATLVLTLTYQRSTTFTVSIADLARSHEVPTITRQFPQAGEPYSVIKLVATDGTVIAQYPFTVPTQARVELFNNGPPQYNPVQTVAESTVEYVLPIEEPQRVGRVLVETSGGTRLDEQTFTYNQLPEDTLQPVSQQPTLWQKIVRFLTPKALAQQAPQRPIINPNQPPGQTDPDKQPTDSSFKLVVINEIAGTSGLSAITANTNNMVNTIEPWATYQDQVEVIQVNNFYPLECEDSAIPGSGLVLPTCANSGAIFRALEAQNVTDWDSIVVVTGTNCNCGSSFLNSGIAAVGRGTTPEVIAHELGHAVPGTAMEDEYLYLFNVAGSASGPNCFATQADCQAALGNQADNGTGQCSAGCNSVSSWRPATQLMHSAIAPFGPVEECIMGRAIAQVIGQEHDCGEADPEEEEEDEEPDGEYYGPAR